MLPYHAADYRISWGAGTSLTIYAYTLVADLCIFGIVLKTGIPQPAQGPPVQYLKYRLYMCVAKLHVGG